MSDEEEVVVTGANTEAETVISDTEKAPPPGESDEVVKLKKQVSGLQTAASTERHKRQTIEQEYDKLKAPVKPDYDQLNPDAVKQIVASTLADERRVADQVTANKAWDERIEAGQKTHADVNLSDVIQDESFYP